MAIQYSKKPGEEVYINEMQVSTVCISANVTIKKGNIYTTDSNGHLTVVPVKDGVADLNSGIFQAMADNDDPGGSETTGFRHVQVLRTGSCVILRATANVTAGSMVKLATSGNAVIADKVESLTKNETRSKDFLGHVREIYAGSADTGERKRVTEDDDLVIIRI